MNTSIPKPPPLPPTGGNKPNPEKPTQPSVAQPGAPKPTTGQQPLKPPSQPPTTQPVASQPATGLPAPQPATSKPSPQPTAGLPAPQPTAGLPTPQPTAGLPTPQPTAGLPAPKPSSTPNILEQPAAPSYNTNPNEQESKEPVRVNIEPESETVSTPNISEQLTTTPPAQNKPRTFIIDTDDETASTPQTPNTPSTDWEDENDNTISSYESLEEDFDNTENLYGYNNTQTFKMGRESILPKIFKSILWLGVIAGLAVGGWLLSPYVIQWFNLVFPSETVEESDITIVAPIDVDEQTPQTSSGEYFRISEITGETTTVPYKTASQNTVDIELQLESIQRTTEFGSILEVAKVQLRGTAPQELTPEQIEEGLERYRFTIVRMNMVYTGEPLNLTEQPALKIEYPTNDGNPIVDSTSNIRNHYIINISGNNTEAGIKFLIESQNCNASPTIPDEFWQGNYPIQACFIALSPDGFDSVTYVNPVTSEPVIFNSNYQE